MEIVCYVIIYFVEALILWLYCSDLFTAKYSLRRTILLLSASYSLLFFLSLLDLYWLNGIAFLIVNFLLIFLFYDSSWSTALFHAGITTVAMTLGELLSFSFFPNFARHLYETHSDNTILIICSLSSKLLYFFMLYILSHLPVIRANKKAAGGRGALVLVPIPLVTFFIATTLFVIYHTTDISTTLNNMIAVCSILLLLLNLLIWFFFSLTQKRNHEFTELQLSLVKENDLAEYYKMLSSQHENRSILIHDIKNNLFTIANLAKQNQTTEIIDYISKLLQTASLQSSDSLRICTNNTLNAILCRYKEECKKRNIDFVIDRLDNNLGFMTANDLTALFCNLLDNAVEAASGVPDSLIKLNILNQENSPFVLLSIENSCPKNPINTHGKLPSHKKDASRHGFGMKSVQRTIKNYGGELEIHYNETEQTFCVMISIRA